MLECPREITGAVCGEIISMLHEEFPSGLLYHVRVSAKCPWLGWGFIKHFEPGGISPLGAGGPPRVTFGLVLPIGVLSIGSGKGCHLLGLGDCLGGGVGEAAVVGCSSTGRSLLWWDEWRQWRCLPQEGVI